MACFLVPTAEAIATTVVKKAVKKVDGPQEVTFAGKLNWLIKLLVGGSILLAFEHIWHGEVVPWFPFLTAMSDPGDAAAMFHEMATVGVSMAVFLTAVWVCMVLAAKKIAADKKIPDTTLA